MLLASSCFLEPPVLEYRGMIDFPACPGMCHLYGFLIQGFLASLHFHFLDCLISQLLHVETVRHTACGREADTCCLLHVRSHVEGLWKRLRLENFSRAEVIVRTSVPFMIAMILPKRSFFYLSELYKVHPMKG